MNVGSTDVIVDIGQSSMRVGLAEDGCESPARSCFAPPSRTLADPDAVHALAVAIVAAISSVDGPRVRTATIGMTGYRQDSGLLAALATEIASSLQLRQVVIADDAWTGFHGALPRGRGAVVTAGTGAVTLAIGTDDRIVKVDGIGHWLGDHGSGFEIGSQAVRSALRVLEIGATPTRLGELLLERCHSTDELRRAVHASAAPVKTMASFVPLVGMAARSGDPISLEVLDRAGRSLGRSAAAALEQVASEPAPLVSYVGGVFELGDLVLDPLRAELSRRCPSATLRPPAGDAFDGARRLYAHLDRLARRPHVFTLATST